MSNTESYIAAVIAVAAIIAATAIFAPAQLPLLLPILAPVIVSFLALMRSNKAADHAEDASQHAEAASEHARRAAGIIEAVVGPLPSQASTTPLTTAEADPLDRFRYDAPEVDPASPDPNAPPPYTGRSS